jgi:MFS transporter, PPP family, 3-phenylpropionic acid transporter
VLRTVASDAEVSAAPERADWRELLLHAAFLRMLVFAFLAFLFLQGPMSLFPIWVRAQGGGVEDLSLMWVLMLLPEIPLMVLAGPGLRRFGARTLLGVGVGAGALRWLVCGLVDDPFWRYAAQTLHGVTVTGLLVGSPLYVDASVPSTLRATAQGVLSMAGVGVGGILSALATGWLHDHVDPNAPYWLGGTGALALACFVTVIVPPPERSDR